MLLVPKGEVLDLKYVRCHHLTSWHRIWAPANVQGLPLGTARQLRGTESGALQLT